MKITCPAKPKSSAFRHTKQQECGSFSGFARVAGNAAVILLKKTSLRFDAEFLSRLDRHCPDNGTMKPPQKIFYTFSNIRLRFSKICVIIESGISPDGRSPRPVNAMTNR